MIDCGERIKAVRKSRGYSAEYVAEKLGVSPATIYRYEKGDIEKVPGDTLVKIADILGTDPSYLMGWEDNTNSGNENLSVYFSRLSNDPNSRMLLDVVPDATSEEISAIAAFFKTLRGMQNDD